MPRNTASLAALAAALLLCVLAVGWPGAARAAELVMVEQRGCAYCKRWDEEIGPIWPRTPAGRFAPLRRIDLHEPLPEDLDLARRPVLTPTFIVVDDAGRELARLEGYPGEDFFWPVIEQILADKAGFAPEPARP